MILRNLSRYNHQAHRRSHYFHKTIAIIKKNDFSASFSPLMQFSVKANPRSSSSINAKVSVNPESLSPQSTSSSPSSHSSHFSSSNSSDVSSSFDLQDLFETYQCESPSTNVTATKDECISYLKQMSTIRRLEMVSDQLYKNKLIRGFCHLSIGQEAVAVGIEAALKKEDHIITAYRCHGFAYVRGVSIHSILAELLGKITGSSKGKGGSMHIFGPNFYGGNGIVGAQVPVGAGVAFAQKYKESGQVTFALYGDGAANQGQVFEAYNMAALWKLPIIFVCENNGYGMGTSAKRSSASTEYYKRAQYLPGIRVNGMDVLAVKEAARFSKQWLLDGKGPLVLDMVTYRYSGHSMSDPGTTYRTREEVTQQRETKDPIKLLQKRILDCNWATEDELHDIDRSIRAEVEAASEQAQKDPEPSVDEQLWKDIYAPGTEVPLVKGCDYDDYRS